MEKGKRRNRTRWSMIIVSGIAAICVAGVFCTKEDHQAEHTDSVSKEEVWESSMEIEDRDIEEENEPDDSEDSVYWFIPQAEECLFTEPEKERLQSMVLSAADSVREFYQDVICADAPVYMSGVSELTGEKRKAVVEHLGKDGLVSVGEDIDMQNPDQIREFYSDYLNGRDSIVMIFEVLEDGLIGAITFLFRDNQLQTYYIGVRWKEGAVPEVQGTTVSNVSEMKLTEKGYFIYAYEDVVPHASLRQYWRIEPFTEDYRALTEKYISGLSYVNYNFQQGCPPLQARRALSGV